MSEQTNPIISFKNFSFQYRAQKKPTLHDINLDIYPGERVLIAGPSNFPVGKKEKQRQEYAGGVHQRAEPVFQPRRMHRQPDGRRCGCAQQQHF